MRGGWVVRLPTWLGDTVMALPTLRALSRACGGRILLWGPPKYAGLLAASGFGGYLPYRRRPGLAGLADVARAVTQLRRHRLQGALLLPNAFEPALIAALARIPRRVGYATDGRGALLTDAPAPPPPHRQRHEADRFAALLDAVGCEAPRAGDGLLGVPSRAERWAERALPPGSEYLALVPGAANGPAKQWPPASFATLAELAQRRWGARPVLLGAGTDAAPAAAIRAACGVECIDTVGRADVVQLAALLGRCRAIVSNDTGAAHLAAALGRPTLVLFGPTDPRRTRPRGPRVRTASAGVFCQPCRSQVCPLDHRCMTGLAPERVVARLESLWRP